MSTYGRLIGNRGYTGLLASLFLGAFNDNAFKLVVSLVAVNIGAGAAGAGEGASAGAGYVSMVGGIFILPYLLFSGYAAAAADNLSKRAVIVAMKLFEVGAAVVILASLISGNFYFMLAALFLMACQSAFLSPAKYGILPEMLPPEGLSRANGLLEMSTFIAIILGTAAGSLVFAAWKDQLVYAGLFAVAVSVFGAWFALATPRVRPSGAGTRVGGNPWAEVARGLSTLKREPVLGWTAAGVAWFWFLGALLQMVILLFGRHEMGLTDLETGFLVTFLALGIGAGSVAAGRLSGEKVEPGLVPIGSAGMALFTVTLSLSGGSYPMAAASTALTGFSGGLFIVPLKTLLQRKSGVAERGRVIATSNFLNTVGILTASATLWLLGAGGLGPAPVVLFIGVASAASTVLAVRLLPDFLLRFTLWFLTHTRYRIRIRGGGNVPARGGALLVANHVSFADPLLVGSCAQRFIRFMVHTDFYEKGALNPVMRLLKAIPVPDGSSREVVKSIARARKELAEGHVVCIFAEGMITRTGNLLGFKSGFEKIVKGLDVPVIPVHIGGVWGSIFSFKGGRFFTKVPEEYVRRVTVSFGEPLGPGATAWEARQKIAELGCEAVAGEVRPADTLHGRFIRTTRRRRRALAMADSTGARLTRGQALAASIALSRRFAGTFAGEKTVAVMLPATVAGSLANVSLLMAGKVPVNLNFTAGTDHMADALEKCGAASVLTSRRFAENGGVAGALSVLERHCHIVYMEDIRADLGQGARLFAAAASLLPGAAIDALFTRGSATSSSLATIIFTSGSTGDPKGVMLTHGNILSNIAGFSRVFGLTGRDVLLGVIPFFHSFGFTASIWYPLTQGFAVVYHSNPLDAATVGRMAREHRATVMVGAPSFYAAYTKKCAPGDFSTVRYAISGAEKLREGVARAFRERFGVELLEGYGATEMAPVVSVNTPEVRHGRITQTGRKAGSVGRAIPGVAAMVVDPGSGETLAPGAEGLLLVKGPGMMTGYLGDSEATDRAIRDGWYVTGDVASICPEGFITITDRLSRFSKVGGEMVPHMKIEDTIREITGTEAAVTAVADESRGEVLVAFYARCGLEPGELAKRLRGAGLPALWIPKPSNMVEVDEVPKTGAGKPDLARIKEMARDVAGAGPGRSGPT